MTALHEISEIASSIDAEFQNYGLSLEPIATAAPIAGAVTMVEFSNGSAPDTASITIVVDDLAGSEALQAVVSATTAAYGQLQPGQPASLPSSEAVGALHGPPADTFTILANGTAVGVLIRQRDHTPMETPPVTAAPASHPTPGAATHPASGNELAMLRDVVLEVTVELGRDSMTLREMLELSVGSVVELDRAAGSPVDIRVNGILFGRGEVVVVDDEYAVRILEILESTGS